MRSRHSLQRPDCRRPGDSSLLHAGPGQKDQAQRNLWHAQPRIARSENAAVTMVSYAIVYRHGLKQYVIDAKAAGIVGAIVPDLLVEESAELTAICKAADFNLIQLVTPTTPRERALRIARSSTGLLYYVSVTGITGERTELPPSLLEDVGWLRSQTDL